MNSNTYTRPTATKATSVGQRGRTLWADLLDKQACVLLPAIDVMAAKEVLASAIRKRPGRDHAAWMSVRTRVAQTAILDVLRARHLKNTGREISRSEVLAALMAAGLRASVNRREFGTPS